MSRGIAIFTLIAACLPAWAAVEETPLRRSINSILEMRRQDRVADARIACDSALPLTDGKTAADGDQAILFTLCGNICELTGDLAECRLLLETALSLWKKVLGPAHVQVGTAILNLANLHALAGRYELSLQCAREAFHIYETSFGPQSVMLNDALVSMGVAEVMLRQYADAEADLKRALSLRPSTALDGSDSASLFSSLGFLYFRQGRYFDAELWYQRAGARPGSALDFAKILANLGSVYVATSRYSKADAACSKAIEQLTRLLGPDHLEVAATLQILAQVRIGQHRYTEAIELLERALQITVRVSGPDQLHTSAILNRIGATYALDARYPEAETTLRRAIPSRRSWAPMPTESFPYPFITWRSRARSREGTPRRWTWRPARYPSARPICPMPIPPY